MNRRSFLIGTLASTLVAKLSTPVIKVLKHIPGLRELIQRATLTASKPAYELAEAGRLEKFGWVDRKDASDALGQWLINDMKANPKKYLPNG